MVKTRGFISFGYKYGAVQTDMNAGQPTPLGPYSADESLQTPRIQLDAVSGQLSIEGKSMPEDPQKVYGPVINWLREYQKNPAPSTVLTLKLYYYNTSTSKMLMAVLGILGEIHRAGFPAQVCWLYRAEDLDMEEAGYDFKELTLLPFKYVPIEG